MSKYEVLYINDGCVEKELQHLLQEEPLSIRIQGNPYSVVMRSPGDEIAHVAGFCLGEGIIDSPEDIANIAFCDGSDTNVVTVTLHPSRRNKITEHLSRRGYISQTSCGLCGKEMVEELIQMLTPIENGVELEFSKICKCIHNLTKHQPLRQKTQASHAAAIFDSEYNLIASAEDVGRHNALDKAIGKLFLEKQINRACLLVLSSRVSYELVQKAARARIPIIFGFSRPTSLAVDLAKSLNIAVGCQAKISGSYIFCGNNRIKGI